MPERLPRNACDTHLHVFGDAKTYPVNNPNALYQPPQDCTFAAMQALHDAMGIERAVLVQATIYGTDHRLLHDALKAAPKGRYRGVAIVDDSVSDAELARLHAVGVRGARFNFGGAFKLAPSLDGMRRSLERVRELGWFVKVFGFGDDFLAVEAELRKIRLPAIVDHMGGPEYARGTSAPAIRLILDLLKNENWWIGLSNGDLRSQQDEPWNDAVEFGRLFYQAAPDRCMWGTDWPHVHRFIRPHGDHPQGPDQEFKRVALLERYVPDRAARDRVLVDNPARFFGSESGVRPMAASEGRPTFAQACQAFDWSVALGELGWSGQTGVALADTIVDRHARGSGAARTAIHWVGADGAERRITFGELARQSARFGNLLRRLGVQPGDRVATVLPRIPEAMSAIIGVLRTGAILVPVFTGFAPEAVAFRLHHSGAKVACVGSRFRHLVSPLDGLTVLTVGGAPAEPGDIDGDDALRRESDHCEPARTHRNEPAAIIYTSGSTGQPKGCVIAANILAAMWPYVRHGLDLRAGTDVFWPTGDPSWGYGLCCYLPALAVGASVLCVEPNATPELCRDIIARFKVTNLATTPTVLRGLMAQGEAISDFGSTVRAISSCGEPLNGEVVSFFQRVWGATPMDHFGATEFGLPVGNHNAVDMAVKPGSMGLPAPGQRMAVVDELGAELPPDEVGLIAQQCDDNTRYWLRYWNDEPATAALRRGSWICTGDLARRDRDGYFWFEGRSDDIIKSSGYRIGPFEIESAILRHGAVAEAAAVGVPDALRGQAIKVFVVLRPGASRIERLADELIEMVRTTCGRHQVPHQIAIVDSPPKTQTGKIQRFLLRSAERAE